jgi:arylsulfatase
MAVRWNDWKIHFLEQRARGMDVWVEPFVPLRFPRLYNLRSDPFERGSVDGQMYYAKWAADRMFALVPAQAIVAEFLKTFEAFPPRQRPASFSIGDALEKAREQQDKLAAMRPEEEEEEVSAPSGEQRPSLH